jgi:hypothetical protein
VKPSPFVSHDIALREALASIEIKEPEIPPELPDGVSVVRRFLKWADSELKGMPIEQLEPDDFSRNPVATCRRATERLLKLILVFLHGGGLADLLGEIWTKGQYEFTPPRPAVVDLPSELMPADLGRLQQKWLVPNNGINFPPVTREERAQGCCF